MGSLLNKLSHHIGYYWFMGSLLRIDQQTKNNWIPLIYYLTQPNFIFISILAGGAKYLMFPKSSSTV